MAKKNTEPKIEVLEIGLKKETESTIIVIVKDYKGLKKDSELDVSYNVARVLVNKGIAKLIK